MSTYTDWRANSNKKHQEQTVWQLKRAHYLYTNAGIEITKSCRSCFFRASSGWFGSSFHHLENFQSIQLLCADQKTVKELPAMIQKLTEEGDHIVDQISNFDEASIYHKCRHLYVSLRSRSTDCFVLLDGLWKLNRWVITWLYLSHYIVSDLTLLMFLTRILISAKILCILLRAWFYMT